MKNKILNFAIEKGTEIMIVGAILGFSPELALHSVAGVFGVLCGYRSIQNNQITLGGKIK